MKKGNKSKYQKKQKQTNSYGLQRECFCTQHTYI